MSTTLLLMTLAAAPLQPQPAPAPAPAAQIDARFTHWLGCWRLEDDLAGTGARLCITPADAGGVKLQTFLVGRLGINEMIVPDGVPHAIADPECKGTERAEWSADGLRLFRTTEVACGTEPARTVSSIIFLGRGPSWINVQQLDGGAARSVRVQRYRRAADQKLGDGSLAPQPSARMVAEAPLPTDHDWSVDDVIEATRKAKADAVQAALSEGRGPFDLNRKSLLAMADAEVPERVVDLMVALTYPERFVVNRAGGGGASTPVGISMGGGWYDPFLSPYGYSPMYSCYGYQAFYAHVGCYNLYGSFYGNYYGYDYRYNNRYDGGWVPIGTISPGGDGTPRAEGRVINGRGYTQVRPREPEPTIRTGHAGNGAGYDGGSTSGTSGVTSSGYSGGSAGSGSDGGARTAVPRPPGGH